MRGIPKKTLHRTCTGTPTWKRAKTFEGTFALLLPFAILVSIGSAYGQTQPQSFPSPVTKGILGQKDVGALAEIKSYLAAVSATGWQNLQANGTLMYQNGDPRPATLLLMGSEYSRLDIEMGSGTRSLRLGGFAGESQDEGGSLSSLPASTSSAGIVAFARIWADAATSSRVSLYDDGAYIADGHSFHRITMEYAVEGVTGSTSGNHTVATDLYFDPRSHLLLYSVDSVTFHATSQQVFSRVTSYEAYRECEGVQVPIVLRQYLDGQLQWTLQLGQVAVNTALQPNTFSF
jgi:hypothetical protein